MKPTSRRLRRQASAPRTGLASTSPEFGETPLPILEAQAPKCYRPPPLFGYAHRLQGFDTDWVESDAARRSASYSNLASGEYVLQVRSTNRARVWIEDELSFGIRVLPAWWQQWWFRGLALMAAAGMVWALVAWRTRQLRFQSQRLELNVQERTAELRSLTEVLRSESAALQESSLTDPLTGLRNRRYLSQRIGADVAATLASHGDPSLKATDLIFFMVDIDHFKEGNDRWGHDAGDAVLQQMRARLESVFRDSDHLVRWGGEEFLLVARATSRQRACELAERARRAVGDHEFRLPGGQTVRRSCSIGFACLPLSRSHPQAMGWDAVQSLADAALMQAKAEGRDPWIGVLDAGNLSEPELNSAVSAAYRLRSGGLTVQRGGASTNELS